MQLNLDQDQTVLLSQWKIIILKNFLRKKETVPFFFIIIFFSSSFFPHFFVCSFSSLCTIITCLPLPAQPVSSLYHMSISSKRNLVTYFPSQGSRHPENFIPFVKIKKLDLNDNFWNGIALFCQQIMITNRWYEIFIQLANGKMKD